MRLTPLVTELRSSVTLALDARAKAMAAAGRDVVSMACGEPDFPAPEAARRAAITKIEGGDVRYTQAAGTPELRAAIARELGATRGGSWSLDEVAVCHSGKHALSGTLLSLVGPGDEVLVPLPAWSSYVDLVRVAGATPVAVPPAAGCRVDVAALAARVTPRTRAVLVNSPSNPSGHVLEPDEVRALGRLAVEHDLVLVSDEIYRRLVYDGGPATSPASLGPEVRARTAIVDGASKAFAMTGWRIGFVAAPAPLAAAVARLHSQTTGAPNAISQAAFAAALAADPPEVDAMRRAFAERRDVLLAGLERLGLPTPRPRGAFYAFPSVADLVDDRGSEGFCADLLEAEGLALVPGSAFGVDGHVRLSYALSLDGIHEALRRLERFVRTRRG